MLIGELADATGVTAKTLRFYEQQGLVPAPPRTSGGYRDYGDGIVHRVGFIRQARAAGLTLRQIAEILAIRDDGHAPCRHVADLVDEQLEAVESRLRELRRTRNQLRELRGRLDDLDPDDCPEGAICTAVTAG